MDEVNMVVLVIVLLEINSLEALGVHTFNASFHFSNHLVGLLFILVIEYRLLFYLLVLLGLDLHSFLRHELLHLCPARHFRNVIYIVVLLHLQIKSQQVREGNDVADVEWIIRVELNRHRTSLRS